MKNCNSFGCDGGKACGFQDTPFSIGKERRSEGWHTARFRSRHSTFKFKLHALVRYLRRYQYAYMSMLDAVQVCIVVYVF